MKKLILLLALCFVFTVVANGQTNDHCTPSATVYEGDLEPGGIVAFGVLSGSNSVTVDHINTGSGLQSLTLVSSNGNQVVNIPEFSPGTYDPVNVTFQRIDSNTPVNFVLRAASFHNSIFIFVRCK